MAYSFIKFNFLLIYIMSFYAFLSFYVQYAKNKSEYLSLCSIRYFKAFIVSLIYSYFLIRRNILLNIM